MTNILYKLATGWSESLLISRCHFNVVSFRSEMHASYCFSDPNYRTWPVWSIVRKMTISTVYNYVLYVNHSPPKVKFSKMQETMCSLYLYFILGFKNICFELASELSILLHASRPCPWGNAGMAHSIFAVTQVLLASRGGGARQGFSHM